MSETVVQRENEDRIISDQPLKLPALSATIWLALKDCTDRILDQFPALQQYFGNMEEESFNMHLLKEMHQNQKNHLYLQFLALIVNSVRHMNKMFQSKVVDFLRLLQEPKGLYHGLLARILKPFILCMQSKSTMHLDFANMLLCSWMQTRQIWARVF